MANESYREGDWFAVPLRNGGFGFGVVARINPGGILFGYFFGPVSRDLPNVDAFSTFKAEDAIMVARFGHLGLKDGSWFNLGQAKQWNRGDWPIPSFCRYEELTGRSLRVEYDQNDPNRVVKLDPVPPGASEQIPKDRLLGAGALEKILTSSLSDGSLP
ncbi:MAG: Imm26 family immunity protein [Acidimicrobiales bacterium]|jgi:hypothetical protein